MFEDALAALGELLGGEPEPARGGEAHRDLRLAAPDLPVLLADWLAELAYLAESEGFVPARAERIALSGAALDATVAGHLGDPPHLVKAVTYHRLEFGRGDWGWHARVVLDV